MSFSHPLFFFAAFYGVFILPEYLYHYLNDNNYNGLVAVALLDQILAFLIAILIYISYKYCTSHFCVSNLSHLHSKAVVTEDGSLNQYFSRARWLLVSSIALLLIVGIASGQNPLRDPLGFRQSIQGGGKSYFLLFFLFSYKFYGVVFFEKIVNKSVKWLDCILLAVSIVFCLFSGFTSLFVYVFMAGFVYISLRYRVVIVRPIVVICFLLLICFTPFYTLLRELKRSGIEVDFEVLIGYWDKISVNFFKVIFDRFDYFDNFVYGSFFARQNSDFTRVFDFFYQPLPRGIFIDKPPNFSTLMTGYVYPSNLDIGVTANFGYVAEFVLYFDWLGPYVAGIFMGALLCFLSYKIRQGRTSSLVSAKYSVIFLPYFSSFVIGYINDMGLPTLLMNLLFWFMFFTKKGLNFESSMGYIKKPGWIR